MRSGLRAADVVFAWMPFGPRQQPSLGLSLLKAQLSAVGRDSIIRYAALDFADEIGPDRYDAICRAESTSLLGDWIFASNLFPQSKRQEDRYLRTFIADRSLVEIAKTARRCSAGFLRRISDEILTLEPRVVGFSSTFQQHTACLALARLLKESRPHVRVIMGGANCEAVMGAETIRRFGFVDAVVSGEADVVIVELLQRLIAGESVDDLKGVYTRSNGGRTQAAGYPVAGPVTDMDALPLPDYDDYFEQLAQLPAVEKATKPRILFEMSRGCWWGQKHHCTFCGLNGTSMRFRSKSTARGISELLHLVRTYPTKAIQLVDNILDMRYFDDFIPQVIEGNLGLDIFIEAKANLKKVQIRMLHDAGVHVFQPGVESFSSSVLALMDKGVSGLQNIQLLKWCKEIGTVPRWNMLWGFPLEDEAEYVRIAGLVPYLSHLAPPAYAGPIRLDRFSPNFDQAESRGLRNVRPDPAYEFIYDLPPSSIANLAYSFTFEYDGGRDPAGYTVELSGAIERWRAEHGSSELVFFDFGEGLLIIDTRPRVGVGARTLMGLDRALYLRCDALTGLTQLAELASREGCALSCDDLQERLEPLVNAGLMLRERKKYLSLAIPLGEYAPNQEFQARLNALSSLPAAETIATSRV